MKKPPRLKTTVPLPLNKLTAAELRSILYLSLSQRQIADACRARSIPIAKYKFDAATRLAAALLQEGPGTLRLTLTSP